MVPRKPGLVGEMVYRRLDWLGRTTEWLAGEIDLSPRHVSFLLQGKSPLTLRVAVAIEKAIGLDARRLMIAFVDEQLPRARAGEPSYMAMQQARRIKARDQR